MFLLKDTEPCYDSSVRNGHWKRPISLLAPLPCNDLSASASRLSLAEIGDSRRSCVSGAIDIESATVMSKMRSIKTSQQRSSLPAQSAAVDSLGRSREAQRSVNWLLPTSPTDKTRVLDVLSLTKSVSRAHPALSSQMISVLG